jgi:phosphoribosylanthranilate isomerase
MILITIMDKKDKRDRLSIKICGLRDTVNVLSLAKLEPDYMGFILYNGSARFIGLEDAICLIRSLPENVQTVAVLVNEPIENAFEIAGSGAFNIIQLHGDEDPDYCEKLHNHIDIIKAFHIKDSFPVNMPDYEPYCSMFLFDTESGTPGGSGKKFDHSILSGYSSETGFLLGGGIGPEDHSYVSSLDLPGFSGVDLNSRFEVSPGIKDINLLKKFIESLRK